VTPLELNGAFTHVRPTTSCGADPLWSILPFGKEEITGRESFTYIAQRACSDVRPACRLLPRRAGAFSTIRAF
jgi:hypothetical protein